ncbi:hypothetical protein N0V82_004607 [Gnomoniopsis sp. IMI 355080]|nr:hypothetical protein N0V82_004607 [Gnomoniopsis sp. IMI 355080]
MEIIHLPHDLFLLILARLSARTIVLCRRVSKGWHDAFTDQDLNLQLLKHCFPRCRELRIAYAAAAAAGGDNTAAFAALKRSPPGQVFDSIDGLDGILNTSNGTLGQDWTSTFARVASRYHHLRTARPQSISKIRLGTNGPDKYRFYGSATWDRYLRLDDKVAPFHYPDPTWCYAQEEGLLVYHAHPDDVEDSPRTYVYPWRLLDLETGEEFEVAFPHDDERVVRRVRLAAGVLVFEWCERLAYHQLNDREECHRHYITAFDVVRNTTDSTPRKAGNWETIQRAEWKLHFLGLPLNHNDRFLSTHTATHYAVYVWQPNRSPWGEDDPIESVIVWDISSSKEPPRIIRRMTWPVLAFYGVRQRATPRLRCLGMDERNLFFVEEEHRWERGSHSSLSAPRVHLVRTTGVPVIPEPVESPASREYNAQDDGAQVKDENDRIAHGPAWLDKCGANGDVNLSFCSRLDAPSYFQPTDTAFYTSGSPGLWNGTPPPGTRVRTTFTEEIRAAMHASPVRWPGWAPCWRHEEFPYLTVSEMVDFKAGVRVTARYCFMLETLSVHARPSLSIGGLGGLSGAASSVNSTTLVAQENNIEDTEVLQTVPAHFNGKLKAARKHEKRKAGEENEMDEDDEVQFADEMWDKLLGKGYICGDERWLIGEDREGSITIARF